MRCADCGQEIEEVREGIWANRNKMALRVFTCRYEITDDDHISSADYHYVEGETQRKFRASS